ncbi:hypothetical protein MPH_05756 [Macrophomina phaseolina MS6]|uniref:Uncharacterized protein n=1 Tax=Macrophomina phaseolina (strain MS6) TaxID=1126212 RepID=K2R424_MACPH|nr:hypothetical protein MPH_05756 [Macrophomina phaseolina MS6]
MFGQSRGHQSQASLAVPRRLSRPGLHSRGHATAAPLLDQHLCYHQHRAPPVSCLAACRYSNRVPAPICPAQLARFVRPPPCLDKRQKSAGECLRELHLGHHRDAPGAGCRRERSECSGGVLVLRDSRRACSCRRVHPRGAQSGGRFRSGFADDKRDHVDRDAVLRRAAGVGDRASGD